MAYTVNVNSMPSVDVADLPTVDVNVLDIPSVDVNSLPDMRITDIGPVGPVTLAGIPNNFTVGISSLPDVNLRIREIPSFRAHIPANFKLGLSVLGVELAALQLCGEAQIITEPFVPNPCERCGGTTQRVPADTAVGAILRLTNK